MGFLGPVEKLKIGDLLYPALQNIIFYTIRQQRVRCVCARTSYVTHVFIVDFTFCSPFCLIYRCHGLHAHVTIISCALYINIFFIILHNIIIIISISSLSLDIVIRRELARPPLALVSFRLSRTSCSASCDVATTVS